MPIACNLCAYFPIEVLVAAQPKNVIIISNPKMQSQYFTAFLTWFKLIINLCVLAPLSSQYISEKMLSAWSSFQHGARHLI